MIKTNTIERVYYKLDKKAFINRRLHFILGVFINEVKDIEVITFNISNVEFEMIDTILQKYSDNEGNPIDGTEEQFTDDCLKAIDEYITPIYEKALKQYPISDEQFDRIKRGIEKYNKERRNN